MSCECGAILEVSMAMTLVLFLFILVFNSFHCVLNGPVHDESEEFTPRDESQDWFVEKFQNKMYKFSANGVIKLQLNYIK